MTIPKTELPDPRDQRLDEYGTRELVEAFIDDQSLAASAARAASSQIAAAVTAAVARIEAGGRLVYVGAGTSGRLGLLDSVELHPTFSWPPERSIAILAGGAPALMVAVEGAEDNREQGAADVRAANVGASDVVICLAASGTTPFVLGAIGAAREAGALTIGIANNAGAPVALEAEIGITLDTGHELISGSTRMKAATAQKIALNTFSSALMVRLHKVYGNLMVDLKPTNAKLRHRAIRLTMLASGADEYRARAALEESGFQVKVAIVAIVRRLDASGARSRLAAVGGSLRAALAR